MLKFNVVWRLLLVLICAGLGLFYMYNNHATTAIVWGVGTFLWAFNASVTSYGNALKDTERVYRG
jgi:hypothetical protein